MNKNRLVGLVLNMLARNVLNGQPLAEGFLDGGMMYYLSKKEENGVNGYVLHEESHRGDGEEILAVAWMFPEADTSL
jgi:hypothetical protein